MSRQRDAADRHAFRNPDCGRRIGYQHPRCRETFSEHFAGSRAPHLARGPRIPRRSHPQQGHRRQLRRLCYPCRWRPDPATQFHSGPYPLRPGGVLCFGLPRHHHRNADPKGPQRRDHLTVGADQRRAQQQQRHARARHGHRLPHDRPLAGPQKLQSGVVAPGPDPRQRIRRGIRGLGIRRYGTGAASEQQRRTAASHEIPGRRLPPPSRQSLSGKLRHQRTALSGKHPRAPHPLRKGPRPAPYPENILSRGGSAAVVGG